MFLIHTQNSNNLSQTLTSVSGESTATPVSPWLVFYPSSRGNLYYYLFWQMWLKSYTLLILVLVLFFLLLLQRRHYWFPGFFGNSGVPAEYQISYGTESYEKTRYSNTSKEINRWVNKQQQQQTNPEGKSTFIFCSLFNSFFYKEKILFHLCCDLLPWQLTCELIIYSISYWLLWSQAFGIPVENILEGKDIPLFSKDFVKSDMAKWCLLSK